VPAYGSAYVREGMAENNRIGARGEEPLENAGRKQRNLALRPASRVIDPTIMTGNREELGGCDQTSSFSESIEEWGVSCRGKSYLRLGR
jgi:hypothetical protein